jgi:carbon-monoxide dehydrogenase small subunit
MADERRRMRITRSFTVARPAAAVWAFFQDVPAVASCLPGAELVESRDDGVQRGRVGISLGPFKASFEGEATIKTDPATRSGHVEGRGVDKRGGSHSRMTLDYRLNDDAGATRVDLDVDLTLSGPIAQFGRTGLVTETANVLIADFARNLEDRISTSARTAGNVAQPAKRINVLAILLEAVRTRIRILFGRQT